MMILIVMIMIMQTSCSAALSLATAAALMNSSYTATATAGSKPVDLAHNDTAAHVVDVATQPQKQVDASVVARCIVGNNFMGDLYFGTDGETYFYNSIATIITHHHYCISPSITCIDDHCL